MLIDYIWTDKAKDADENALSVGAKRASVTNFGRRII